MWDSPHRLVEFDELETPDGIIVDMHNAWDHWILSVSGEGMPPINWITDQGPFQDGESVRDFRLLTRVLQYNIIWNKACNRQDYWDMRAALINYIRPNRTLTDERFGQMILRKKFPPGTAGPAVLELPVVIADGPKFNQRTTSAWREWDIIETLRFLAHDPVWIDPEIKTATTIFDESQELKFPITFDANNIIFSGGVLQQDLLVTTLGTWIVYPTILLTGPLTDPTITNESTGEIIELDYEIPAGRVVTIDLSIEAKTVIDDLGTVLNGSLTPESDLADFHLEVDPKVTGGINTINVLASDVNTDSRFDILWNDRYIGM